MTALRNSLLRLLLITLYLVLIPKLTFAQLTVAAAADLQFAMADVAHRFEQQTGKPIRVTYGSSGNFFQQLENGAPFDVFFSANLDYAKRLEQEGYAEPGSLYEYAQGKLAMWVPSSSSLDLRKGLKLLLDPSIKKIAIANPQHAPYGQAAVAAMKKAGVYDSVQSKLALGENISQTFSFVDSGAADIGLVAVSLVVSPNVKGKGHFAEIAADEYPPIHQACVILKSSKNKEIARQFLAFVRSPAIAAVLRDYGFEVPRSSK